MIMSNSRALRRRTLPILATAALIGLTGVGFASAADSRNADAAAPRTAVPKAQESASEQVQEVMARYVRATDHRDGRTLAALFTESGTVKIAAKNAQGSYDAVVPPITGRDAIADAVANAQAPLPALGSEHHIITAPITDISGDTAHLNMQFITYAVQGKQEPAEGWPAGTAGSQGTVTPYESGYYDAKLVRSAGGWQVAELNILGDLPIIIPGS